MVAEAQRDLKKFTEMLLQVKQRTGLVPSL